MDVLEEGLQRAREELPAIKWIYKSWQESHKDKPEIPEDFLFLMAEYVSEVKRTLKRNT